MFIPNNLIPPALPVSSELDTRPVHASSSAGVASPASTSLANHAKPPVAPTARRSTVQKMLYDTLAYVRGRAADGSNLPANLDNLPSELVLTIAEQATPQAAAQLGGVNRSLRNTLENQVKLGSILGNAANLRDNDHFKALLDGTEKEKNKVSHAVPDLPPQEQAQALEALASNLINMSRSFMDQMYSIEDFNAFMAKYQGPFTPMLKEFKELTIKLEDKREGPQSIDWHFQVRQQSHFPAILERTKNGEALDDLCREFAITTTSAKNFLAEQANK